MKRFWLLLLCLFLSISFFVACDNGKDEDDKDDKTEENGGEKDDGIYEVGEKAILDIGMDKGKVEITLDIVEESTYKGALEEGEVYVCFTFTAKNDSEEEYTLSSLMLFNVFFDGNEEEAEWSVMPIVIGDYTQIDHTLQPGETFTGTMAYTTAETWQSVAIDFIPSLMASDSITFTYEK